MAHVGSELNTSFVNWAFPEGKVRSHLLPFQPAAFNLAVLQVQERVSEAVTSRKAPCKVHSYTAGWEPSPGPPPPPRLAGWKAGLRQAGCGLVSSLVRAAKKCPTGWALPQQSRKSRENRPAHTPKSNGVFGDGQIRTAGRRRVTKRQAIHTTPK